jgi:phosphate transport system substrate-binding protein
MKKTIIGLVLALSTTLAHAQDKTVTGAGATFPYPVYAKWADAYRKETGITVNYQSVGSGAGIKQIQAKTVTFGATDMPLTQTQLDKDGLHQFPMVIGGNVVVFNLDGIKSNQLVLTGDVVADIYLGKITKWNDKRITDLNPNVNLPNQTILVVRRSDGSGTTYLFTKYLSSVSQEWNTKIGAAAAIEWPVGIGAKGNEGVAGNVKQTKFSIGYVEYAFAKQNQIAYTSLKVVDKVIVAGKESFQKDWPIAAPTYILMHKNPTNKEQAKLALDFFKWAYEKGDTMADELDYVPLSSEEKAKNIEGWKVIN